MILDKTQPATSIHPIVLLLWVGLIVSLVLLALVFDKHKRKRYEEAMIIDELREWSEDELFGKNMEAMRADSMEECWDKINACVIPSVSQMRQELSDAGWLQKNAVEYQSPCGKLHRGPYGAWKAMKKG